MRVQKGNTGSRELQAERGMRGGALRNGKYESEEGMSKPLMTDFLATWLEDSIKNSEDRYLTKTRQCRFRINGSLNKSSRSHWSGRFQISPNTPCFSHCSWSLLITSW